MGYNQRNINRNNTKRPLNFSIGKYFMVMAKWSQSTSWDWVEKAALQDKKYGWTRIEPEIMFFWGGEQKKFWVPNEQKHKNLLKL